MHVLASSRRAAGATAAVVGRAVQQKGEVGWTGGTDSHVAEGEAKMKAKAEELGKHKQDGQSQSQAALGAAAVVRKTRGNTTLVSGEFATGSSGC